LSPLCSARLRAPNEVTKTCESFLPDRPSVWQVLARLVPVAAQLPVSTRSGHSINRVQT
jgi:hypothetical protein